MLQGGWLVLANHAEVSSNGNALVKVGIMYLYDLMSIGVIYDHRDVIVPIRFDEYKYTHDYRGTKAAALQKKSPACLTPFKESAKNPPTRHHPGVHYAARTRVCPEEKWR